VKLKYLVNGREVAAQGFAQARVRRSHAIAGQHKLCPLGVDSRKFGLERFKSLAFCVLRFCNLARDAGSPIKQPFQ
jgi:hypothetical protein